MTVQAAVKNVHARKLAVMQKCSAITPDKVHAHHGFPYISVQAISNHLRQFAVEEGLDIIASVGDLMTMIELVNVDQPDDRIVAHFPLVEDDKAWAYSIKFALIRLFLIGDGEEGDEAEMATRSGATNGSARRATPAPGPSGAAPARQAPPVTTASRRPDAPRVGPGTLPGARRPAPVDDDIPPPSDEDR